jgi:cyclase
MTGGCASPEPRLEEIADGVFAYVQPHGGWCVNNAGILVGREGTVLIDTVATRPRAVRLREQVEKLSSGPVRTIVNTHHHGDHTFGNCEFGTGPTVIAHELAVGEMIEAGLGLTGLWPDVDWGELELVLPSVTFADRLTIHVDSRRVELLYVGPAHTTNDVVAWLPEERVLFTGDVVMSGCTPFVLMGSVSGSLTALQRLRELDPLVVVSGHGPVSGPESIDTTERYLLRLQEIAEDGVSQGLTPLDAARTADLGDLAELLDTERIVGNLHRAYAERAGEPAGAALDVVEKAFYEMVEYNNGALPKCLA